MLQKQLKFDIKSVDEEGKFSGLAAAYGNLDSDSEIIDQGCFKRSISHTGGKGIPVCWTHDLRTPIAWGTFAEERKDGLYVEAQFLLNTEQGRTAYEWAKMGAALGANVGISVGFRPTKDGSYYKDGVKHFKDAQLIEYSLCVLQANPMARVATVKTDGPRTKRVAGEDLTADCFAYVGDPDKTETWKLPIKFSTEAKTVSHIRNALARFSQTQGIPESERAAVLAKIRRAAKEHGIDTGEDKSQKDFNESLAEAEAQQELWQERYAYDSALSDAIQDALDDDSLSADEQKAAIEASYSQYAEAMSDWYSRFIDSDTDDDAEEDLDDMKQAKEGRAISAATANRIQMAVDHIQKGLDHLKPFAERPYTANDTNQPNPVGGGKADKSEDAPEDDHAISELEKKLRSVADLFKAA